MQLHRPCDRTKFADSNGVAWRSFLLKRKLEMCSKTAKGDDADGGDGPPSRFFGATDGLAAVLELVHAKIRRNLHLENMFLT